MLRDFSGGKQVINFANTRNRGRVCLFLTTEKTVDVLTASNNDVNFVETQTVHFP